LEEAIESGGLTPGARGFARRQAEVAKVALREPWDGEDGRSRLRAVQDERLERWLQRGPGGRADERRAVLDGVAATVSVEPPAIDLLLGGKVSSKAASALARRLSPWLGKRTGWTITRPWCSRFAAAYSRTIASKSARL